MQDVLWLICTGNFNFSKFCRQEEKYIFSPALGGRGVLKLPSTRKSVSKVGAYFCYESCLIHMPQMFGVDRSILFIQILQDMAFPSLNFAIFLWGSFPRNRLVFTAFKFKLCYCCYS
jgi:hypothetical protein